MTLARLAIRLGAHPSLGDGSQKLLGAGGGRYLAGVSSVERSTQWSPAELSSCRMASGRRSSQRGYLAFKTTSGCGTKRISLVSDGLAAAILFRTANVVMRSCANNGQIAYDNVPYGKLLANATTEPGNHPAPRLPAFLPSMPAFGSA
jgi:hypothetical protein